MLLTPPDILIHPCPYAKILKQYLIPMLASVEPVTSAVTKIQPAQPEKPEAQVYGSNVKVGPYGLFPAGNMDKMV